jgi:hypothetical protein
MNQIVESMSATYKHDQQLVLLEFFGPERALLQQVTIPWAIFVHMSAKMSVDRVQSEIAASTAPTSEEVN